MMGHCKDCKHWNEDRCLCHALDNDMEDFPYNSTPCPNEIGMAIVYSVADDSGLDLGLKTGPLFGCTLFKKKA